MVAQVRRFNRTVTQRVGALNDRFLARSLPLGEARLLWEIGTEGCDVRSLRTRLDLDAGYLSRLLRSLESAGLVAVEPSAADKRVRTARLTQHGRAEVAVLDRRSNELAASLLTPLSTGQRDRLIAAMAVVERLLTAGTVEIRAVDPDHDHARHCVREYFSELARRFDTGFDPALSIPVTSDELRPPAGLLLVAYHRLVPVGCGGLRFHAGGPTEIKRMWVAQEARGLGVGRRVLAELESYAQRRGDQVLRLETNKALVEAIGMYRSAGYREVTAFNDEPYAHHWFEKHLQAPES